MASFIETFSLINLSDEDSPCFFSRGPEIGEILVVHDRNVVGLYDIAAQREIKAWIVRQASAFTSPVVYNSVNKTYLGVLNSKTLFRWTDDAEDFQQEGKKISMHSPIHSVHCGNAMEMENIVVFEGGHVETLTEILADRKSPRVERFNPQLFNIECVCVHPNGDVGYLACNKRSGELVVHLSVVAENSPSVYLGHQTLHISKSKVITATLVKSEKTIIVILLCNDGKLYELEISRDNFPSDFRKQDHISPLNLYDEKEVHINAFGGQSVLITGASATDDDDANCLLLDMKYGIVLASASLPSEHIKQISSQDGFLFCQTANGITATEFKCTSVTLASVVGERKHVDNQIVGQPWLNTSDFKLPGLGDSKMVEHFPRDVQLLIMQKQGKSLSVICSEVFSYLLKNRSIRSLCAALQQFDTIPESILVQCLDLFLTEVDAVFRNEMTQQEICNANGLHIGPFHIARAECINKVILVKFDNTNLREELKKLKFQLAAMLLRYLNHLMMHVSLSKEKKRPELSQVMEWMCILVDAHYHSIISSRDPELFAVFKLISDHLNIMKVTLQDVSEIEALTNSIKKNPVVRQPTSNSPYSITRMRIG